MCKKFFLIFILSFLLLTGCATALQQSDQIDVESFNQSSQPEEKKVVHLDNELDDFNNYNIYQQGRSDVRLRKVTIFSNESYENGKYAGYIYGKFDVLVSVVNVSRRTQENIKIITMYQRYNPDQKGSKPALQTAVYTIPYLRAGQSANINFRGFRADNPKLVQEVIVNLPTYRSINKTRIKAVDEF